MIPAGGDDQIALLPQPDDEDLDDRGVARRASPDTKLARTLLTSEGLQKRLLDLYFDARTWKKSRASTSSIFLSVS